MALGCHDWAPNRPLEIWYAGDILEWDIESDKLEDPLQTVDSTPNDLSWHPKCSVISSSSMSILRLPGSPLLVASLLKSSQIRHVPFHHFFPSLCSSTYFQSPLGQPAPHSPCACQERSSAQTRWCTTCLSPGPWWCQCVFKAPLCEHSSLASVKCFLSKPRAPVSWPSPGPTSPTASTTFH